MENNARKFAPIVLRYGLAAVFFWFGISQLVSPDQWVTWVPDWASAISHMPTRTIVLLNGGFETLAALFLLLGVYTRWAALLLGLHTLLIAFEVGYNAIAVRDVAIAIAAFSTSLNGEDSWSLHRKDS